jgi:hypothetical protein
MYGSANSDDLANHFQARRVGKRVGDQDRPVAGPDLEVGMVDGRSDAANAYLVRLQRRNGNDFMMEHIGTAILSHDDRCTL